MAEQLALSKVSVRATHETAMKGPAARRLSLCMARASSFLPGPAFAEDQDVGVALRGGIGQIEDLLHRSTLAYQIVKLILFL